METKEDSISTAEHILLEGDETDPDLIESGPRTPQQHFHLLNRSHAIQTEIVLFEGGWLSVRHHKRSKPGEARMINLRFLDPTPKIARYFAKRTLAMFIVLGLAGLISAILAWYSVLIVITAPAAILLCTAAVVTFGACAYRTRKDVVFLTRHGRAPVISLMATLGSFRSLRAIVPQLTSAIQQSTDAEADIQKHLRSEMREHYRLRECGVLDESTCADSTQRILRHFS